MVDQDNQIRVEPTDDGAGLQGDDERAAAEPAEATVPCEYLTGIAGSGKSFQWIERSRQDPTWGLVTGTTGIASINLGVVTLNSTLRFFDTASLRDAYLNGSLIRRLKELREDYRRLVIDEVSMMDGEQLSIIVRGLLECNSYLSPKH